MYKKRATIYMSCVIISAILFVGYKLLADYLDGEYFFHFLFFKRFSDVYLVLLPLCVLLPLIIVRMIFPLETKYRLLSIFSIYVFYIAFFWTVELYYSRYSGSIHLSRYGFGIPLLFIATLDVFLFTHPILLLTQNTREKTLRGIFILADITFILLILNLGFWTVFSI